MVTVMIEMLPLASRDSTRIGRISVDTMSPRETPRDSQRIQRHDPESPLECAPGRLRRVLGD